MCLLMAEVMPSQRINSPPHVAWTAVEKTGCRIITGHCTCVAGCGEVCSHVAAILFKVERLEITKETCTSLPCTWNQVYSTKVQPATISEIDFTTPAKRRQLEGTNLSAASHVPYDDSPRLSRDFILNELYSVNPSAVVFTVTSCSSASNQPITSTPCELPPSLPSQSNEGSELFIQPVLPVQQQQQQLDLPPPLKDLYDPQLQNATNDHITSCCEDIFRRLTVTDVQAKNVFLLTKNQSETTLWFTHQLGRITSSQMAPVLKYKGLKYPSSIINAIMQYTTVNPNIASLKWGRDHEETARRKYEELMREKHDGFETLTSGLIINPKFPYMGVSPDGISTCKCCGTRLLEIKCPYTLRNESPTSKSALSNNAYCLKVVDQKIELSRKHDYYIQIQGQLLITEEKYCDFVCWTPKGIFVETIPSNTNFKDRIPIFKNFFCSYILPELLTHKFKNGTEEMAPTDLSSDEDKQYCFCGENKPGRMIGCDNPNCTIEWFHYSCVGIKRKPKGEWFCKNCK